MCNKLFLTIVLLPKCFEKLLSSLRKYFENVVCIYKSFTVVPAPLNLTATQQRKDGFHISFSSVSDAVDGYEVTVVAKHNLSDSNTFPLTKNATSATVMPNQLFEDLHDSTSKK